MPEDGTLVERLTNRNAVVGVIGLGYVGLPLSIEFAEAGFDVAGFDIDEGRVARLQDGDSYVDDVSGDEIESALDAGFEPRAEPSILAECDAFVIAVPTGVHGGEPDMTAVEEASRTIANWTSKRETLVVVSSTVYPGATHEIVEPIVTEANGTTHFAMIPERLNPGGEHDFSEIPLVVGANTDRERRAATALFDAIVSKTHPVDSTETAELTKTLENTYRMVNIALMNEFVSLSERVDADLWEAIQAAGTKPFGFQPFYPGPGVGGHCIPVDPQFLTWRASDCGTDLPLVEHANRINQGMPETVSKRIETALRNRGVALEEASIVALGATYKPNVADLRNSPALEVIESVASTADVTVVDPHLEPGDVPAVRLEPTVEELEEGLESADAVVLLVDHDAFDLAAIADRSSFVFDTRDEVPAVEGTDVLTLGERPVDRRLEPRASR